MTSPRLPIFDIESGLIAALRYGSRTIVTAPTGSGKSTQIPQMLLDHGFAEHGRIVVLQPRRIAARMLARRVAWERNVSLGSEIGYQVRFENHSNNATKVKYETDGIIMRELILDPTLSHVAVIVFDEFHERHLHSDLMLGFAKQLQSGQRPDLKIVVMSATLDTQQLSAYLAPCPLLATEGRTYPVNIRHIEPNARLEAAPPWEQVTRELPALLREESAGDVLIFMPGAYEIRRTTEALSRESWAKPFDILPLHGQLPPDQQDRAVQPGANRRIIVATNVAETSLTIDGVTMVVDSGLVRMARFDPRRGINTLLVEKNSQASADQRAGRAGRVRPGQCLRLWTEREHARRPARHEPELNRVDLSETILQLKCCGVPDLAAFPWIAPPPAGSIEKGTQLLRDLGALDQADKLTAIGGKLASFPLHPRISRMLVAAEYYGCLPTMCLLAALLQEQSILLRRVDSQVRARRLKLLHNTEPSDVALLLAAWESARDRGFDAAQCDAMGVHGRTARAAERLRDQLLRTARSLDLDCTEPTRQVMDSVYRSLLAGFPDQVVLRTGSGRCSLPHRRRGTISAESVVDRKHKLLVAADIMEVGAGKGDVDTKVGLLAPIRREWLSELFPNAFSRQREVFFDTGARHVKAEERIVFRDLVIETGSAAEATDDEAAAVLGNEIVAGRLTLKHWDARVEQWIARVNLVARHCPELGVPAITGDDREELMRQLCYGARGAKEVKQREVWPVLGAWLDTPQRQAVEAYAPERVTIENGRTPRVNYDDPHGPYIAMRIQELYDTHRTPRICLDRVTLKVRILAPNQRPIQITDDLAGFWENGYQQARKDLRGRYPKHEWR